MGLAAASKMAPAASASLTPDLCCSGRRPDDMPWNAMECHGMPTNKPPVGDGLQGNSQQISMAISATEIPGTYRI